MLNSIRWKLVVSFGLLTLLTVSILGILSLWAVQHYIQQQEILYLTSNAEAIAEQAEELLWPVPSQTKLKRLAQTASFFSSVQVRIIDLDKNILVDSGYPNSSDEIAWLLFPSGSSDQEFFPQPIIEDWILGILPIQSSQLLEEGFQSLPGIKSKDSLAVIKRENGPWGSRFSFEIVSALDQQALLDENISETDVPPAGRTITVPISNTKRTYGYVELRAGTDFGEQALKTTRRALILAGSAALMVSVVIGMLIGRRLSAPISDLIETTQKISSGDFTVRAQIKSKDEIGELASRFNFMTEKLQDSFSDLAAERDTLRRFIADASHELRTPITALKNFYELLQDTAKKDPAAHTQFLKESLEQIDRLSWITNNLLDLSRLDAGLTSLNFGENDVQQMIENAAEPLIHTASEKGIKVHSHFPDDQLLLVCDKARFEIVICNLLDNAIKNTLPGGEIEIGALRTKKSIRIWVKDTGSGIEISDQPHIFKRFYRGSNQLQGGSGLGLSIVESTVKAHGGRIHFESEPGVGSRFSMDWPLESH